MQKSHCVKEEGTGQNTHCVNSDKEEGTGQNTHCVNTIDDTQDENNQERALPLLIPIVPFLPH